MNPLFDVIVVGSGPAGVSTAYPLIKAGLRVAIIDGGLTRKKNEKLDDFSDINLTENSNGYDLFKNNSFIFNKTYRLLRIKSNVEVFQTLSKGGFSKFWHGISDFFTSSELKTLGLPVNQIQKEYKEIAKQINLKSNLTLDIHNSLILKAAKSESHLSSNIYKLSSATNYTNTLSVDVFKKFKNFTYIPNQLVYKIKDGSKFVKAETISIDNSLKSIFQARFLILAAGSINTTRILLRSLDLFNYKTTFLTKAHYVIVCLHLRTLFKKKVSGKKRLGQLAISSKQKQKGLAKFFIQLFNFNLQSIDRAIKYLPILKSLGKISLKIIAPCLIFADVRFPAFESKDKFCILKKDSDKKDILEIQFKETEKELKDHQEELKKIKKQLKILGLIPLKTGSDYITSHYAGGVPYKQKDGKISVEISGKLHKANRIYIADASSWRALPSKPPTLTIMANAARIGKNILRFFQK